MQAICSSGGDVLNVGFGLGLVDRAIQSNQPRSHTIVEAHPGVLRKVSSTLVLHKPTNLSSVHNPVNVSCTQSCGFESPHSVTCIWLIALVTTHCMLFWSSIVS